jgi:hypothetical protein
VPVDVPLRLRSIGSWSRDVQVDCSASLSGFEQLYVLLDKVELKALVVYSPPIYRSLVWVQ